MSATRCYDDFSDSSSFTDRWAFLEMELPDFGRCRCEEPTAKTSLDNGILTVRVDEFRRFDDQVQVFDNPKHMVLSTETFRVPRSGTTAFSVEMAAENVGGDPDDYRDGFVTFNVLDMSTGWVWDHALTSRRSWAIHEHLYVPGFVPYEESLSWIVENAIHLPGIDGTEFHEFRIEIDAGRGHARWLVDGRPTFEVAAPIIPERLQIGFGLVTLHQIRHGRSTSLRGQGLAGMFRNVWVPT